VILDRHRYLEKIMEEHKKNEEKKKLEEEEKLKKEQEELEILEKKKEEEQKANTINNNFSIDNSVEIIEEESQIDINNIENNNNNSENENENFNLNKINKNNGIEVEKINILVNNIINKNENSDNINYIEKGNISNIYEEIGNDFTKIREKIELNSLLKNLNYIDEDDIYEEKNNFNLEIPYYLTKEWVVKNLLN